MGLASRQNPMRNERPLAEPTAGGWPAVAVAHR